MTPDPVTFEHFEIARREDGSLHELGRGAMGVTYKALDTRLGSHVALKVISPEYLDNEMARERFLREARAAAHLNHPNVAAIFHRGQNGATFFYAMQFIEGETLDAFVKRRGFLGAALALRLILQSSQGLAAANERGLIHRDIKPANLMLVQNGSQDDEDLLVKIIDFGLAKTLHKEAGGNEVSLTGGGPIGTPYYMSPEQIDPGTVEIDARTDIYSLGVTLWYLLAGKPPFLGSQFQVFNQHMLKAPPLETLPASVPAPVGELLGRMLAKNPAGRPANHRELVLAIKTLLRNPAVNSEGSADSSTFSEQSTIAPRSGTTETGVPTPADLPSQVLPEADRYPVGLDLTAVLQKRGTLSPQEALLIIGSIVPSSEIEGNMPNLRAEVLRFSFEPGVTSVDGLAARPLSGWPPWKLRINDVSASQTAALAGATLAMGSVVENDSAVRQLAALFYELIKGSPLTQVPGTSAGPAPVPPLPALSESANAVVRRGLVEGENAFDSPGKFQEELALAVNERGRGPVVPPLPLGEPQRGSGIQLGEPRNGTTSRIPILAAVVVGAVVLTGGASWWLLRKPQEHTGKVIAAAMPTASPLPSPVVAAAIAPEAVPTPVPTVSMAVVSASPSIASRKDDPNPASIDDSLRLAPLPTSKPVGSATPTPKPKLLPIEKLLASTASNPTATPKAGPTPSLPKTYQGKVGNYNAEYTLQWSDTTMNVSGTYVYTSGGDRNVYQLKGTNDGKGHLEMKEYTEGVVSAALKLDKSIQNGEVIWSGTMFNTDGRSFPVVMKRKQDTPGN